MDQRDQSELNSVAFKDEEQIVVGPHSEEHVVEVLPCEETFSPSSFERRCRSHASWGKAEWEGKVSEAPLQKLFTCPALSHRLGYPCEHQVSTHSCSSFLEACLESGSPINVGRRQQPVDIL